jgi:hypothetical protein
MLEEHGIPYQMEQTMDFPAFFFLMLIQVMHKALAY